MKVGDLVKVKVHPSGTGIPAKIGVMVDVIQKKCWRTQERGPNVDWDLIDPEPHGVVLYPHGTLNIPMGELEEA